MTELHYPAIMISVSGITGKTSVAATGAISKIKDVFSNVDYKGLSECEAVKLIKNEMAARGYGFPRIEYK